VLLVSVVVSPVTKFAMMLGRDAVTRLMDMGGSRVYSLRELVWRAESKVETESFLRSRYFAN